MPPRSPSTYAEPDPLADILDGLPEEGPVTVIKTAAAVPARLYGGNAQEVEVRGLDYTLHLDLEKLPESEAPIANDGKWTVVWDEVENTYKRIEFTSLSGGEAGPPGPPGPPGGPATVLTGGGIVLSARNVVEVSEVDAAVQVISTQGFATPGDHGDGCYKRMATAPVPYEIPENGIAMHVNAGYVRSVDRYTSTGATDATNGGWWQLMPTLGAVTPEQFGAKGDSNGTTGTDDYLAFMDAFNFTAWEANAFTEFAHKVQMRATRYFIGQTLNLFDNVVFEGVAGGSGQAHGSATELIFAPNTTGIVVHGSNTGPTEDASTSSYGEAGCTRIRNFAIRGSGSEDTHRGLLVRQVCHLENLQLYAIPGDGIFFRGGTASVGSLKGQPNGSYCINCLVHSCNGHALHFLGADANACVTIGFKTGSGNSIGKSTIYDDSQLGNQYFGCMLHSSGGGALGRGVHYAGKWYQYIGTAGLGSTVPGTNNNIWYYIRDGVVTPPAFAEWNPALPYEPTIPVWTRGNSSSFLAIYNESGFTLGHVPPPGIVIGGNLGCTAPSNSMASSTTGFNVTSNYRATKAFQPGDPAYSLNGSSTWVSLGDDDEAGGMSGATTGGVKFLMHRRLSDGDSSWHFGYRGKDIEYVSNTARGAIWRISTNTTDIKFGRPLSSQPGYIEFHDYAIRDQTLADSRIFGLRTVIPSAAGEYARGEQRFNMNATTTGAFACAGWICTTTGALGTAYANGVNYTTANYVKSAAGRMYKCTTDPGAGLSSEEPTHTSGEVVGADGYGWTYIAAEAVWRPFGPIMGNTVLGATSVSEPLFDLAQTWQNAATTYTALKTNITDTASATASKLLDLQVGGVSRFAIRKDGTPLISDVAMANIAEAPNDGVQYARQSSGWAAVQASSGLSTAEYTYNTTITPPPVSGGLRLNHATQSSATAIYLHDVNALGVDITNALKLIVAGDKILVQDKANSANHHYYTASGAPTDNTTYFTVPVTWTSGGTNFTAGRVIFAVFGLGTGGGSTDGDKGDIVVSGGGTVWTLDSAVVTAAAKTVLDDTTVAAMRTTLGAAPMATTSTSAPSGGVDGDVWYQVV